MTVLQQYLGRFYCDSTMNNFSIGARAITLTTGYYFICGYTSEAANQFCEHMQSAIRTDGTYTSATVTYSATTGKITIATGGAAAALTWTDSALQTLLGFTGTQSSATSHVATNQPRYVWRPSKAWSNYPGDPTNVWVPRSLTKTMRSKSGTTFGVVGNTLYDAYAIEHVLLPSTDVLTSSTTVWESFQQFWLDVFANAEQIRLYPDRTLATSTSFVTGVPITGDDGLGSFGDYAKRHIKTYNGLWNVSMKLWKYM